VPYVEVFLPDDLLEAAVSRDLPLSEMLQVAVMAVVEREKSREGLEEYIRELEDELSEK
jgi:post-segregation antitoxin (ccd killing protein)